MSDTSGAAANSGGNSGPEAFDPTVFLGPDPDNLNTDKINADLLKAFGGGDGEEESTEEQSGEEGQETGEGINEPPETPPAAEQPEPQDLADFSTVFEARYQRKPTNAELEAMFQLTEWYAGLAPEQLQTIDQALSQPQYQQYQQYQQQQPQPQPQPQPDSSVADELAKVAEDDPSLLPVVEHLRNLERNLFQMSQQSVQQQQQRIVQDMTVGSERFKSEYAVNDVELNALQGAVLQSGIWPGFVQQAQGNTTQAMQDALSYFYWQTPSFRDREMARRIEELAATKQVNDGRKQRAAAVTGTGGNGASRTNPPKQVTNDNRWGIVADELREVMSNGQTN
jgi:hypothetical protein